MADAVYCVCFIFPILIFNLEFITAQHKAELHPASDFSKHTLIKPKIFHGREKRQISTTKESSGTHLHHLTVTYDLDGKDYIIDLQLNKDLLPKGYFRSHQRDGKNVVNKPVEEDAELCHYKGKLRGNLNSWAALSTCEDRLRGVIYDGKEMHYLEKNLYDLNDLHILYKHSDLVDQNKTCGYQGDAIDHHITKNDEFNRILRYKRDTKTAERVRGPYNANKQSRYVELVLVVDNREFKELGESKTKAEQHCKDIANIINALYSPLNIFIALVGVVIWTEYDEIDFAPNGDRTLTNFLHYRREKLIKDHPNDNAQLLTKFNFENGVVGKALKGPICTFEYSGGVNTDHSPIIGLVATTVAHEMGHNFGMEHDTNECECPDRCIMAPSSSSAAPTHWSSCSLEYLALAFEHGMDYCLRNKPSTLFDSPVCGNGFVEPGEQCDCGLPEHCDNTCCNSTTCLLFSNATCATGECCDLNTCGPKKAGSLCRSADYECDLPEYCTGQSEYCPKDIYKMDGEICDGTKAYCYHGFCRTRTDQCKLLWGNTGKSSDEQCYKMNNKGSRHGNCGYSKLNQSFFKCDDDNVLCGMLHCKHLNEKLEFGMDSVAILSHSFINLKGSVIPCRTAIVDLGINQVDPGLTPDGAKCGEGMMCVSQKCMPVADLQKNYHCPQDCNGNGICNSLGHCHCHDGFAPPFCDYPGVGGSEDSGPAADPNARKEFVTAMFVIFLGVIPAFAILGLLIYYAKQNLKLSWKKSPATKKSKSTSKHQGSTPFQSTEPTKRNEDNHSLLQDESQSPGFQTGFFGQFGGFSITPIQKCEPEPVRPAPPVPNAPVAPPTAAKNVNRSQSSINTKVNSANKNISRTQSLKPNNLANEISVAPALPPLNPGSHPRPIISLPILEASTCTAKELLSPLKNAPKIPSRPAPITPQDCSENKRPLSTVSTIINSTTLTDENKKPAKENVGTLNRIASFLKSNDKKQQTNTNSLPRIHSAKDKKGLDKSALRSIEISNPILQTEIEIAKTAEPINVEDKKPVVMRAQSMRGATVTPRPAIPNFGSMRQPSGMKRPVSIPTGNRPTSPPPPRPPVLELKSETKRGIMKLPGFSGFKKGPSEVKINQKQNQYDDCLNEAILTNISEESSPSTDNIYAVIDETPQVVPIVNSLQPVKNNSESTENIGLLGEIVSEIQNRNLESIYSASTLARKKKEREENQLKQKTDCAKSSDAADTYVNTLSPYRSPDSIYSNMNNIKSSASSTSSGYINPSLVNQPIKSTVSAVVNDIAVKIKEPDLPNNLSKPTLSTFKTNTKPFATTFHRPLGPILSSIKSNGVKDATESDVAENKVAKPTIKQETPSNLRARRPSPSRAALSSPSRVAPLSPSRAAPPSPVRTVPLSPKNGPKVKPTNSPDLVTSCSADNRQINSSKSPDVLSNSGSVTKKPNVPNVPKAIPKVNKLNSVNVTSKKQTAKPVVTPKLNKTVSDAGIGNKAKTAARSQSNVASLQQKFENKLPVNPKTIVKK